MADDETEVTDDGSAPEVETPDETGSAPVDKTTDEPEAGTDPVEAQPADDEPEEYRKALAKVGGDKGKLGQEYWQAKNALSAASKERAKLEARLKELEGRTRQPERPEVPPPPAEPHPDIKKLDERITAFTQRGAEIEQSQRQTLIDLNNATIERQVLERQLKVGDEFMAPEVKAELKAELRMAANREQQLLEKFQNADERKELNQERLDRVKQEKDFAAKHLEGAKARQEQAEAERATFFEEFPQQIDGYITDICDDLKVPPDEELRNYIWEVANAHVIHLLSPYNGQGIPADQVDYQGVLRANIERTVKVLDKAGRAAVGKVSKAKLGVTSRPGVPRPMVARDPAQPYDRETDPNLAQARERLARLGL